MVWDILLQAAAGLFFGVAVGYGITTIITALSRAFAELWRNLVTASEYIWGYVTEATQYLLANIALFLDNNWDEIEYYLSKEFGYRTAWYVTIFKQNQEVFLGFMDSMSSPGRSLIGSIGMLEPGSDIQLPTQQHQIVTKLTLS